MSTKPGEKFIGKSSEADRSEGSVHGRLMAGEPRLKATRPSELLLELKAILFRAYNDNASQTPQNEIEHHVRLNPGSPTPPDIGLHAIEGATKDFSRKPISGAIRRDDGAWIHFTITLDWDGRRELTLRAYDFEIVFEPGHSPPFVRIDLNRPDHANAAKELRSHLHPGNDDLLVPSPVMTPAEILRLFIYGLRPRDLEKPRR